MDLRFKGLTGLDRDRLLFLYICRCKLVLTDSNLAYFWPSRLKYICIQVL